MKIDTLFKALSDPTRRKILDLLKEGDKSAGKICAEFQISGASVSNHLSILKNADLVIGTRKGQHIIYSLNTTIFQEVMEWFISFKDSK